jgi:transcriptional regulator with XRE-family HTH domain
MYIARYVHSYILIPLFYRLKEILKRGKKMKTNDNNNSSERVDIILGKRLTAVMKLHNLNKTALAKKVGISPNQITKYELGINRISVSRLVSICRALKVSIEVFIAPHYNKKISATKHLSLLYRLWMTYDSPVIRYLLEELSLEIHKHEKNKDDIPEIMHRNKDIVSFKQ